MKPDDPIADVDMQFSSPDAVPTVWTQARDAIEAAEIFWLATVRPDGRPHVTPLISVWLDGAAWFTTGPTERKALNLERNSHVVLTTGCNRLDEGLDVVLEGRATRETDHATLVRLAAAFAAKYAEPFRFSVRNGAFEGDGGTSLVFRLRPVKVFAFGRGAAFSQTRWRFPDA